MDVLTTTIAISLALFIGIAIGKKAVRSTIASLGIKNIVDRAKFPVGVVEKIEGHYYLFEKDSPNFLCQAPTLEELPKVLMDNKKVTLALMIFPEEYKDKQLWCLNGKLKLFEA